MRASSNLALDIDPGKRPGTRPLEGLQGFIAGYEHDLAVVIFQKFSSIVVNDELSGIGIRFEVQLFCNKAKRHIWFVSVICQRPNEARRANVTYALLMLHIAARRSRVTNISMRYAPMLGVSLKSWKKRW